MADFSRLLSSLNISKTAVSNNPLYQTVKGLIDELQKFGDLISSTLASLGKTTAKVVTDQQILKDKTYLTATDETSDLPNSRELLSGTNISFDDTTPGQRTVNASPGSSGITQLTSDVTAGPGSGSQVATIANDAVTLAKIQNITNHTAIGRDTAGTGDPELVTISQMLDWL